MRREHRLASIIIIDRLIRPVRTIIIRGIKIISEARIYYRVTANFKININIFHIYHVTVVS